MTREEKIKRLIDAMADWDHEVLLEWAQDMMGQCLEQCPPDVLDEEYEVAFGDCPGGCDCECDCEDKEECPCDGCEGEQDGCSCDYKNKLN